MVKVTAADIKVALRRLYPDPEWAILFEVGDATGARHTRFADAVVMSLWPSRGLTLTGIEIKVSRSDWNKERSQPEKAETIAAYCDYWTLLTGPGVVHDVSEIPPAWGWIEYDGARFTTRKTPTLTEAKPVTRQFLAALLRRASRTDKAAIDAEIDRRNSEMEARFNERVEMAARRRTAASEDAIAAIEQFEQASGIKIGDYSRFTGTGTDIGRVTKAIIASGIDSSWNGLYAIADTLRKASDEIEKAMIEHGFDRRQPSLSDHARRRGRR
ncbi:hypothetical protein [Brucella intermedia]|uniref:Uncharacterized protein n=1 Tax=Brucella intermedia M86 TaxID=1234597 RepID=M5JLB8_9HYPH|nr:hypothetical protein [Brucella intermedia]ELT47402.1 hypothetical protein D584_19918 [Brucella intermedia M86]